MADFNINWTQLKNIIDNGSLSWYYFESNEIYEIYGNQGPLVYICKLIKAVDVTDVTDFETNYKNTVSPIIQQTTTTVIAPNQSMDVTVTAEEIDKKLRYAQLTKNQVIANGSYTTVYMYSGTGKFYGGYLKLSDKEMILKITVDNEDVILDLDIEDLPKGDDDGGSTPFICRSDDKELHIEFPGAIKYVTSISIALRSSKTGKKLSRGYMVLTQET